MRMISWNVRNGGGRRRAEQLEALLVRVPAFVALQEVTLPSLAAFRDAFVAGGMEHVVDSFSLAPDPQLLSSPLGPIELHTTHIPPGATNGWIKIEMLEGIYQRLARTCDVPRILCGDFNTPKEEHPDGTVVTWGSRMRGPRWNAAEDGVVRGLAEHGLVDVYRHLHGYGVAAASIVIRGRPRRYDHVFASPALRPLSCTYLNEHREKGLSDHAPVEVDFSRLDG